MKCCIHKALRLLGNCFSGILTIPAGWSKESSLKPFVVLLFGVIFTAGNAYAYQIRDEVRRGQDIQFHWTFNGLESVDFSNADRFYSIIITVEGEKPFGVDIPLFDFGLGKFDFRSQYPVFAGKSASFTFFSPRFATDWKQKIFSADGSSEVFGGNVKKGSPWAFEQLDLLPNISARIPDLAPSGVDLGLTIYTAVNLDLYKSSNPLGFLAGEWSIGDLLSNLNLEIIGGQMTGLEGIYWATTPFEFDANPVGRGFTPVGGDINLLGSASFGHEIAIIQQHVDQVPEPNGLALVTLGLAFLWKRRSAIRRISSKF